MGYSPWGRKESDTTERLHLLNVALFCHVLGKIEKAKRKPRESQSVDGKITWGEKEMRAGSWQPSLHHMILPLTTAD